MPDDLEQFESTAIDGLRVWIKTDIVPAVPFDSPRCLKARIYLERGGVWCYMSYQLTNGEEIPPIMWQYFGTLRIDSDNVVAEALKEVALETRQQTLIRLLQKRFGKLSAGVVSAVESTDSIKQLDKWLDQVVTAKTLAEIGIE